MVNLPPYITREKIYERLPLIFPEGTPNRNYCIREMAASTIFAMIYVGAIEGNDIYIGPRHVYKMTSEQANLLTEEERITYRTDAIRPGFKPTNKPWYADTTREPIRDETLRDGLVPLGAVITLGNIPTTSSKPRYALQSSFARLFLPDIDTEELAAAITQWQTENLSAGARARISLAGRSAKASGDRVIVSFPNGEARSITVGPSSDISKAVIEVFATTFLEDPAVLWLSTSDSKVTFLDDEMAARIGLNIQADRNLPDIILVDLGRQNPLLLFVEVVATDGAVTDRRQAALYKLSDEAGFAREQVAFLTAYDDRQAPGFKKTISNLAWNSFAWFMSEPENIIHFKDGSPKIIDILMM